MSESAPPSVSPHRWCLCVFGLRIGFASNRRDGLDLVREAILPGWEVVAGSQGEDSAYHLDAQGDGRYVLWQDGHALCRPTGPSEVAEAFEESLHFFVARRAVDRVFLHAGAVAWKGVGLILPGRSYSGKSTLTLALCQAGAEFYSDEYAVLDAEGRLHPFPRALRMRDGAGREVRLPPGRDPVPVGLVLLTRYRPQASFRPRRVEPGRAVALMLEHAVPARLKPQESLAALCRLVMSGQVYRCARGDAAGAVETLLRRAERPT